MRKLMLTIAAACAVVAHAATFEDAFTAVENMGLGFNLGNTLDCHSSQLDNMWIEASTDRSPNAYETAWGQPAVTRDLIRMLKNAGFTCLRVPVTWYPHMGTVNVTITGTGDNRKGTWDQSTWTGYDVDPAWMARVKEVVDMVINEGLYCIINVHHDTGQEGTAWIKASTNSYNNGQERFAALWTQIANEFKDYGPKLLFEGYNEMLDEDNSWCFPQLHGDRDGSRAMDAYDAVNLYAQKFVDAVRATGGNNAQRNLIINSYAAVCGMDTWDNYHLTLPLNKLNRPNDPADGHIIFEVHYYPVMNDLNSVKNNAEDVFAKLQQYLIQPKNAPVIFGEWGAADQDNGTPNMQVLEPFAKYFVDRTRELGMATMMWRLLIDGDDRANLRWTSEGIADALVKGFYGEEGYVPVIAAGEYGTGLNKLTLHDEELTADHASNHVAMAQGEWHANRIDLTDAHPYMSPVDIEADVVTYTRTFNHDKWQALFLPYDMPYADWADLAKVYKLNDIHQFDNDGDGVFEETKVEYQLVTAGQLNAHTPYIIRPLSTGEITLESHNVTVKAFDPDVHADGYVDCSSTQYTYTFAGTLQSKPDMDGLYALNGGAFQVGDANTAALAPFRVYMTITPRNNAYGTPSAPAPSRISIMVPGEDEDIDGVFDIIVNDGPDVYYDMLGRRVNNPATGLYIKNGKKVFIK